MSQNPNPTVAGSAMAEISNAMVQMHKRYYGKGPTKAKTHFVDDTVLVLLQGGFTIVERTLIDDGRANSVQDIRRSFQAAMKDHFVGAIEDIMGRKVIAYMSQVHTDPDILAEIFVLEPTEEADAVDDGHEPAIVGAGDLS